MKRCYRCTKPASNTAFITGAGLNPTIVRLCDEHAQMLRFLCTNKEAEAVNNLFRRKVAK